MRKLTFALGVLLMFGCSSVDDAAPAVTADKACTDLAAAYCEKANTCASVFVTVAYGDVANCTARFKTSCLTGISAPSTSSTPSDTATCASAVKGATCPALLDNATPTACLPKAGGLDDGKPCHASAQCKSTFCAVPDDATCGACAPKPSPGGSCKNNACPAGLACSSDGVCNAPAAVGGACSGSIPCASGGSCFGGKCVANVATEGAACSAMNGPQCDGTKGLFCITDKCLKPKINTTGAECGYEFDSATSKVTALTICDRGGWCKGIDLKAMPPVLKGKCEAAAADGAACVADDGFDRGPGCLAPAACVAGKCQLADNATCK